MGIKKCENEIDGNVDADAERPSTIIYTVQWKC